MVTGIRTDALTATKTNSSSPVVVTEDVQPVIDRTDSDRKNSGGNTQTTEDRTKNDGESERRTAQSGGNTTTQDRNWVSKSPSP